MNKHATTKQRVVALGIDVGSVTLKATLINSDGQVLKQDSAPVRGQLRQSASGLVHAALQDVSGAIAVGVTGGGKDSLDFGGGAFLENDLVATARAVCRLYPQARGIIEVGGHQSKWVRLGKGRELESFSVTTQVPLRREIG